MAQPLTLHPDRLLPTDPSTRAIAKRLYEHIRALPIVSPHGHTDPAWFATDAPFADPAALLITPDHYLLRMLYSQGIALEQLGVAPRSANTVPADPRKVWRLFASHYHLFRGTPTRLWLDWVFAAVFGLDVRLDGGTADLYFDRIAGQLTDPAYRPRALYERFGIEVLATTESPLDDLRHHRALRTSGWRGRVITTFRPDRVVDPEHEDFHTGLQELGRLTNCDTSSYRGYLDALRDRRRYFAAHGATATDHGHPSAATADLTESAAQALFRRVVDTPASAADAELFRAHMLTVMGSLRNHNRELCARFGRDQGADIPQRTDYVHALKPLLDRYGNRSELTLIIFTLDETAYARELAPLAGHYPALKLGPAWWFHDSPEGMRRFRRQVTETAGLLTLDISPSWSRSINSTKTKRWTSRSICRIGWSNGPTAFESPAPASGHTGLARRRRAASAISA
jgi:glucuronate isomerase